MGSAGPLLPRPAGPVQSREAPSCTGTTVCLPPAAVPSIPLCLACCCTYGGWGTGPLFSLDLRSNAPLALKFSPIYTCSVLSLVVLMLISCFPLLPPLPRSPHICVSFFFLHLLLFQSNVPSVYAILEKSREGLSLSVLIKGELLMRKCCTCHR